MYTGIVQALGKIGFISHLQGSLRVRIEAPGLDFSDVKLGDSIAVNGVCLTVTSYTHQAFEADISPETLSLTTLGNLAVGSDVNLEKSLRPTDRLGGHFVQGHVDGMGEIIRVTPRGNAYQLQIRCPASLMKYIAYKGAICVDGISLTVNAVEGVCLELTLIPHTWENTIAKGYRVGQSVNLEVDMIARYLERLMTPHASGTSGLTEALLMQAGFMTK